MTTTFLVRQQLLGMAPQAIKAIERVLTDPKTSARDRMKAAELILDRAIPTKVSGLRNATAFSRPHDLS